MDKSESEAAAILLELPYLIMAAESGQGHRGDFSFKWGTTRKRSSTAAFTTNLPSSQPVPAVVVVGGPTPTATCDETETETEKEKRPKALSPTTPFLFSPSEESDEKTKQAQAQAQAQHCKRKFSLKRKKEEYLKMEEELTESNRIVKEKLKKLKSDYDRQKALNAAMTDMRINLDLQMQMSLNREMESKSSTQVQPAVKFDIKGQQHQPVIIMDRTAHNIESYHQYQSYGQNQKLSFLLSSSNGGGMFMMNDNHRSFLTLDLNVVPLEESRNTRALAAAAARRRRIQICRSKTTIKLLNPFCR